MPTELPDILPLTPYLREVVWGGRRLLDFGKNLPPQIPIGESFEVSALPDQDCVVRDGPLARCGLRDLLAEHGEGLVGAAVAARYGDDFPLLIKLIDAQDDLSIQVHPDDAYARRAQLGTFGKTEAWYVLRSEGSRLALGLRPGMDAPGLRAALSEGRAEDAVLYQEVAPDDVVFLRAGTVHALCRGVVVYEVQQSSDITFRLYDYGRLGLDGQPRELHLEHGVAVTDFEAPPPQPRAAGSPGPGGRTLIDVPEFGLALRGEDTAEVTTTDAFAAITVIEGSGRFGGANLGLAESALIPAGRRVQVKPAAGLRYLVARPGI